MNKVININILFLQHEMQDCVWQIQVVIRVMAWRRKLFLCLTLSEIRSRLCLGVCGGNDDACCLTLEVSQSRMQGSLASAIIPDCSFSLCLPCLVPESNRDVQRTDWITADQKLRRFNFLRRTSSAGNFWVSQMSSSGPGRSWFLGAWKDPQ